MTERTYDSGTQKLLDDLAAKAPSFDRDEIIARAQKLRYHSYKSPDATPNITLVKHLNAAGFKDLARFAMDDKYEQGPEESRRWAEETEEGRRMTALMDKDPELRAQMNATMEKIAEFGATFDKDGFLDQMDREVAASTPPGDDPDQKHLREVVTYEVQAVLDKHEVGGALLLVSRNAASWRLVHPTWSGLQPDPVHGMRLRLKGKTPEDKANSDSTMHLIAGVRDMSSDLANVFGRLWRQAVDALKAQGAVVEHKPVYGVGGRPDPLGGKID